MRAAIISELGRPPVLEERPEPLSRDGESVVEIVATPLNPLDISLASGKFYGGHPLLPYVPGCEAIGRVVDSNSLEPGTIVWVHGKGFGQRRDGGLAEFASAPDDALVALPDDVDPAVAGALGIAGLAGWLPLAWRAPVRAGERVLVLGATGTVGLVAVQAARLLGAARVVAAGRRRGALARATEAGADATVMLDEAQDLPDAFRQAFDGEGPTYVVDPLWGDPLVAALDAAARGARAVNIGQSAGADATISSAAVRGKQLEILGYSNFAVPREVLAEEYVRLVRHAEAGEIRVDVERVPLDDVTNAWRRQREGAGRKLIVVP